MSATTIRITKGEDVTLNLAFKNPDGSAYSLVGSTVTFIVRRSATVAPIMAKVATITNMAGGLASIALSDTETNIAIRSWQFQIDLTAGQITRLSGVNYLLVSNSENTPGTVGVTIEPSGIGINLTLAGPAGPGISVGGITGQVLTKASNSDGDAIWTTPASASAVQSVAGRTGVVVLAKTDVGLTNVPNTDFTAAVAANTAKNSYPSGDATKLAGIANGATANSSDATLFARANHTGTQSADTLTDGTTNKAFLATERTKLTGVATGATANQTDAYLIARGNQTGTQTASTISDFSTAADARITAANKKTDSMTTNKLLGRGTASTGAIEEITLGTNLTLVGTTLNAAGNAGSTGDMLASVYDPLGKASNTFSQDNMVDGTTNKNYLATEKTKLAAITGTNTGDQTTVSGNAGSATVLQTARTINGVSFNGSANITVADATKEPTVTAGTTAQYYRGDKSMQPLNQDAVPDGATNKAYSSADKTKLAGIAAGATANSSDATLLARANHTGTQPSSTISDFASAASSASPVQSVAGKTGSVTVTKSDVGLGSVDNTSDVSKPVSAAQAAADNLRVLKAGDTMTGNLTLSSDASGGEDTTDSTRRLELNSLQRAQSPRMFGEGIRMNIDTANAKNMIAWYKRFGAGVATFTPGTDVWTATNHYLENGDQVVLSTTGALPSGFAGGTTDNVNNTTGTIYYVINASTTTFQLSTTRGGSSVDGTTTGSGTHSFTGLRVTTAWVGYHYLPNDISDPVSPHNHWSVETPDSTGLLRTRLEVLADHLDTTEIRTANTNFTVANGSNGVTSSNGSPKQFLISTNTGTARAKLARWVIEGTAESESGSNAGTNLKISRFETPAIILTICST